jgi:hypothetical protein
LEETAHPYLLDPFVEWFARDPRGPLLSVPEVAENPPADLAPLLAEQLELIPAETVSATMEDRRFQWFHSAGDQQEVAQQARTWILTEALNHEIPKRRLHELTKNPPQLISHPALAGAAVDDEGLFPL